MKKQPLILMILDGFGLREETEGNAIAAARTPVLEDLWNRWPHTTLGASGLDVGLPDGQMGNSEVGHTNLGAGRIVYQELTRITKSISDGDFFTNPTLVAACENARNGHALHLMGLLSDGGVHSHRDHLYGLLDLAKRQGVERVYIHGFMDGRDVAPTAGAGEVRALLTQLEQKGIGRLSTLCGRYYSMDRDNRWDRVELAYRLLTKGVGEWTADPVGAMEASYAAGVTDEFLKPLRCEEQGMVQPGDSVIFFNFRPDRARELTRAFVDPDFVAFQREQLPLTFACMTRYDATMPGVSVAFAPQQLNNTLGEMVSRGGLTQLRIAETEKYAHVTFFFNGGEEKIFPGEQRILVPSPQVATYDLQPTMSAAEITSKLLERLDQGLDDLIILNYANCDMVGHTGSFPAAVEAVEAVDGCVNQVVQKILERGGKALITADHGNADRMMEENGEPFTAHTTNPVPLIGVGLEGTLQSGVLADLAPTLLELLGLAKPKEMTGHSLFQKKSE